MQEETKRIELEKEIDSYQSVQHKIIKRRVKSVTYNADYRKNNRNSEVSSINIKKYNPV
jgi:hypothetical protein